jgi:hypothetical protein
MSPEDDRQARAVRHGALAAERGQVDIDVAFSTPRLLGGEVRAQQRHGPARLLGGEAISTSARLSWAVSANPMPFPATWYHDLVNGRHVVFSFHRPL